jgi:hypothetical protein
MPSDGEVRTVMGNLEVSLIELSRTLTSFTW